MALANPQRISALTVDISSFPDWAEDLEVREVPWLRVSLTEDHRPPLTQTGTVSERYLMEQLRAWYEDKEPEKGRSTSYGSSP